MSAGPERTPSCVALSFFSHKSLAWVLTINRKVLLEILCLMLSRPNSSP